MKLRPKIFSIIAISVLLIIGTLTTMAIKMTKEDIKNAADSTMCSSSDALRNEIELWLDKKGAVLEGANEAFNNKYSDPSKIKDSDMKIFNFDPEVKTMYLISEDASMYADDTGWRPEKDDDMRTREYYKQAKAADGLILSEVYVDTQTNELLSTIAKPFYDRDGKFFGVIGMDVDLDKLQKFTEGIQLFNGKGIKYVLDINDVVVAGPSEKYIGKPASEVPIVKDFVNSNIKSKKLEKVETGKGDYYTTYQEYESYGLKSYQAVSRNVILERNKTLTKRMVTLGFILLILGMTILWTTIGRMVIKPVKDASEIMQKFAVYNFSDTDIDVHKYRGKDEINIMMRSMAKMRTNLIEVIGHVKNVSNVIVEKSDRLNKNSGAISEGAKAMEQSVREMADSAMRQAQDTDNGLRDINIVADNITTARETVRKMSESINVCDKELIEGNTEINELVSATEKSQEASLVIRKMIEETGLSSKEIKIASNVIAGIAQETNLIAMNAAVEAARVGEHGKGFAVVAEEINKLAVGSSESTNDIDRVVKNLIEKSDESINKMDNVGKLVEIQSEHVYKTGEKYRLISESINEAVNYANIIISETISLDEKKESVVDIFNRLGALAQENAANSQVTTDEIANQTTALVNIGEDAEALDKVAEELNDLVSKFDI